MLINIRHRLEFALLLVIAGVLHAMPLRMATALSAWSWRAVARRTRRHRRALANLARAMPEKSDAEREAIALAMWGNLGRVMAEAFLLERLLKDPSRIDFESRDFVRRYDGRLGASVFASLHMGNWEVVGFPLREVGSRPAAVYRIVDNPYVNAYLYRKRQTVFPAGMFAKGPGRGHKAAARMVSFVREGGQLCMLSDLVDWKGVSVPFFGHDVWASAAPAWLARHCGARLWVARCLRIDNQSRFRIVVTEVQVQRTDNVDEDIKVATAAIYRQFETWIREAPDQWMWSNKRWPDAEARRAAWGDG